MSVDPYGRNTNRGVTLNNRTLEMFEITELRAISFAPLTLTQGSYSSGVSQSGGTHDGGGALDVRAKDLTTAQRETVVKELRRTGFAAWLRTPSQGNWPYHIHAIAIGDKELSTQAKQQVIWYKQGLNGLWPPNQGPDDGPKVAWTEYRQDVDLSYYGPEKWDSTDWKRFEDKGGWGFNTLDGRDVLRNASTILRFIHLNGFEAEDAAKEAVTHLGLVEQTLANMGQQLAAINEKLGIEPTP